MIEKIKIPECNHLVLSLNQFTAVSSLRLKMDRIKKYAKALLEESRLESKTFVPETKDRKKGLAKELGQSIRLFVRIYHILIKCIKARKMFSLLMRVECPTLNSPIIHHLKEKYQH